MRLLGEQFLKVGLSFPLMTEWVCGISEAGDGFPFGSPPSVKEGVLDGTARDEGEVEGVVGVVQWIAKSKCRILAEMRSGFDLSDVGQPIFFDFPTTRK